MPKKTTTDPAALYYRFCGGGTGIPGLPHEVTAAEAEELGLLDVLQAAIENGNYQPVKQPVGAHIIPAGEYIASDSRKE